MHWEKEATQHLLKCGLTWEHARLAIGLIAEHRQIADLQGYARGFNQTGEYTKKYGTKSLSLLVDIFISRSPDFDQKVELASILKEILTDLENVLEGKC